MRAALDQFNDNSIIDEFLNWAPRNKRVVTIRGCLPIVRRPFVELITTDQTSVIRQFPRQLFTDDWAKAVVILQSLTNIKVISEFTFTPYPGQESLIAEIKEVLREAIDDSNQMYDAGMHEMFVMQFGVHFKNLPLDSVNKLKDVRKKLSLVPGISH